MKNNYFFCYSYNLSQYIRSKGIDYITNAINPSSGLRFTLFERSHKLQVAIDQYNLIKKNQN